MSERTIRLHTFCSVKGGVGKTSLAIACAKILAAQGRVPVLIDCDLTGTSLADGLDLRAPKAKLHEDGSIDLEAEPTGNDLYTVAESRRMRARRRFALQTDEKWKDHPHPPPFFNDPLNFAYANKRAPRIDGMIWRHERNDGVLYLPSSSTYDDMTQSLEWFFGEAFDFARAFAINLDALAKQIPSLTDVVVDLPPGIWGFPHYVLDLVSMLHYQDEEPLPEDYAVMRAGAIRWVPNPFLVTSRDPNDLVPALEYIAMHQYRLPLLRPLVNRTIVGISAVRKVVEERLGPMVSLARLDEKMVVVDHLQPLANIFVNGDVDIALLPQSVLNVLRLGNPS